MKKIILTLTAIVISALAYPQSDSVNRTNPDNSVKSDHDMNRAQNHDMNRQPMDQSHDGYRMQNGKMMVSKNGTTTAMENEMTFSDGSVLKSDGTIIRKDGTKLKIKDGEYVDLTGKVVRSDRKKDMYLVPDSTRKSNNK
jgi:hypothetical protein